MNQFARMKFGIFLPPVHLLGENPTASLERDLELIQWVDKLGFDEAWIGEHHSAGWEVVSSPELFIAVAAERTRHIRLGTGVISLPYHHPLMVANRMVLLDHLTRGRVMLGVGPGALATDAYMLGIDSNVQRQRMAESLDVIVRLFTDPEPVTYKSDRFELNEATLHLRPYQKPHIPIAVAAVQTPAGPALAGKHGAAILSVSVPRDTAGQADLNYLWTVAEESAAKHGKTMNREDWRIVSHIHLAATRDEAIADARAGAAAFHRDYFEQTIGRPGDGGPLETIIDRQVESGAWIVGTPDDCIRAIERLIERSGGFGCLLAHVHEWAPREKILKSYELLARYVMPRFQGSTDSLLASNHWARDKVQETKGALDRAFQKARDDYAKEK